MPYALLETTVDHTDHEGNDSNIHPKIFKTYERARKAAFALLQQDYDEYWEMIEDKVKGTAPIETYREGNQFSVDCGEPNCPEITFVINITKVKF